MAIACGSASYFLNAKWTCENTELGPFRLLTYLPKGRETGTTEHVPFYAIEEWFSQSVYNGISVYNGLFSAATYLATSVATFSVFT